MSASHNTTGHTGSVDLRIAGTQKKHTNAITGVLRAPQKHDLVRGGKNSLEGKTAAFGQPTLSLGFRVACGLKGDFQLIRIPEASGEVVRVQKRRTGEPGLTLENSGQK